MRAPRLTTWRIMVAIAVIALACRLEVWRRNIPFCKAQAARCSDAAKAHLWLAESHEKMSAHYRTKRGDVNQSVIFTLGAWGEQGKAKRATERGEAFRRAARYPWLSVPPVWDDPIGSIPEPVVRD